MAEEKLRYESALKSRIRRNDLFLKGLKPQQQEKLASTKTMRISAKMKCDATTASVLH